MAQACRKKIMFVIPSLAGGGAEKVIVLILRHLDRTRFEPIVVVFSAVNDYKEDIPPDVRIISLNKKNRFDNLRLVPALSSVIRAERPDLICSFLYYANYISVLARKISGLDIPLVFTEHANLSERTKKPRLLSLTMMLVKKLYPSADCIVSVSKGVKDDLVANFGILQERSFIIHNPIEIDRIQVLTKEEVEHPWFKERRPVIIACGRLTAQKNYPLLLRAFNIASKEITDLRLIILGEGLLKQELIAYAEELGISDKVAFMGFQKNPFKYIARAKVLVLSSLYEGFGNVLAETMACGTAAISTRCPSGPDEIITDGVNGILVPVDDDVGMADAILRLLKDENLRMRIAKAGRKRARDFMAEKIVKKYEELFELFTRDQRKEESRVTLTGRKNKRVIIGPNFFIVGAAKSGTTSLAENLRQHPQVFFSSFKEPSYFVKDAGYKDFNEYTALFQKAGDAIAIGEASTGYLFDKSAPYAIKEHFPEAKIIIILRNPVDMAFSYWNYMRTIGNESKSFEEAISEGERAYRKTDYFKKKCINWWASYLYLERALYSQQVRRYVDVFGKGRVKIYIFEEFIKNLKDSYRDLFLFLGVDGFFTPNFRISNEGGEVRFRFLKNIINSRHPMLKQFFPAAMRERMRMFLLGLNTMKSKKVKMNPDTRQRLDSFFEEDIRNIETLIERRINAWKKNGLD